MNRYEILTALHNMIVPRAYLEIGVQTGASLTLAKDCPLVVGVDPEMGNITYDCSNAYLIETTSDTFFDDGPVFGENAPLDLVFIDGLHHSDQVWRDLTNAMRLGHSKTVYVLDDMLPRNQEEASRIQCPGDWTGDVWKVGEMVSYFAEDDTIDMLVDTFPTGVMIVCGPCNVDEMAEATEMTDRWANEVWTVPDWILTRDNLFVASPELALETVQTWLSR